MIRPGAVFRAVEPSDLLTLEPTNSDDLDVVLWVHVDGAEQEALSFTAAELRALAADLLARADLIDPPNTAAPAETGA